MPAYRPFFSSLRCPVFYFALALVLSLVGLGCGDAASGAGGMGGTAGSGGGGGAPAPECRTDQDCWELHDLQGGVACNYEGQCYECEHGDPISSAPTPEFWDPTQFQFGSDLGLNPELAYWVLDLEELGLQWVPAPSPVAVCAPITVEEGEVIDNGTGCEYLDEDEYIYDGASLIVPVAPAAWLSSDPLNGLYYTEVFFEFGPIYRC